MRDRLAARDWRLVATLVVLASVATAIVARYFAAAFPEASIDFKVDRTSSARIAERFAIAQGNATAAMKHTARFDSDSTSRIFLERTLGLARANGVMRNDVRVWMWTHRWFVPLQEEEIAVNVAPTGEIIGYSRKLPEDRAVPPAPSTEPPVALLRSLGVDTGDLTLVSTSERKLPRRVQRIYTWESKTIRPGGAPYRHTITMDGALLTGYAQQLKIPDEWLRSYRELRSKNTAAGSVDLVLNGILLIAAVAVFVIRLRRGDVPVRFLLGIGAAAVVLVGGVTLNSLPEQISWYDTTSSWPAFLAQLAFGGVVQSIGTAMMLVVICGAGEVLYRERLPQQLAMPRLWSTRSLTSKRVFLSLILGYALVPLFMAYQVVFYLTAERFGAWSPAEVPYDDMLSSAFPWVAVLFAGFFPAFSEEFLARAFSIPFLQRFVRSRIFAIALSAFIWGFGHSTYANQPWWIRGVEVGIAGIAGGLLMDRFGLAPLLIWHYTIDAVYTATLLFTSGNTYYIVSASLASLLFVLPLFASIALYVKNRGFVPDDDLTNASIPLAPPPPPQEETSEAGLPDAQPLRRPRLLLTAALVIGAVVAILLRPASPSDAVDYRVTKERAKELATAHVGATAAGFARVIATPVEGFRSWDATSTRDDGGSPGSFDATAAGYLLRNGLSVERLTELFREPLPAAMWSVRFFSPRQKEELFVEIDARTEKVVGFHKYQEEGAPGAALTREQAARIAVGAFARYGLNASAFVEREALSFQQPKRRDWLFHFEEKRPLAGRAFRRIEVRVSGDEVTQFNRTVKIPESVYHEQSKQTFVNVVLFVMKVAGIIGLLAVVITGLVIATRAQGLPWRRPLRWTLVLAVIPVVSYFAQYERMLFRYNTSVAWETFRVNLLTGFVRDTGLQIGLVFLALAGLEATLPWAPRVLSRESLRRFGRSAAVAVAGALSIAVLFASVWQAVSNAFPSAASVDLSVPLDPALPFPGVLVVLRAVIAAVAVPAAIALYTTTIRSQLAPITLAAIFCSSVDPLVTPEQLPLSLVRAAAIALLAWLIGRHVLGRNPLAWPLAAFCGVVFTAAARIVGNDRPDLLANGVALALIALGTLIFTATSGFRPDRE